MTSFALVVGIDAYQRQPLHRAVGDAEEFRDALLRHGLVERVNATLLSSDAKSVGVLPTRRNILAALRPLFSATPLHDRMFFYFAGHGVLAFVDPARTITTTALATLDVVDFEDDGDGYIDLGALVRGFRTTGPSEQFYFIDACRNIAWKKHPSINPGVGFKEQAPGPSRGQEILYAVSHLGEALEDKTDGGVFTGHLIEGLDGKGLAVLYDHPTDTGLVTADSLAQHVKHRVSQRLTSVPLWRHKYQLPSLEHHDPRPAPLRTIAAPEASLTIHVDPDDAAPPKTIVTVGTGREVFQGKGWPPAENHQPITLAPTIYRIKAESHAGQAEPAIRSVDIRLESELTVRVSAPPPPPTPVGPSAEAAPAHVAITNTGAATATVVANAKEPTVTIKLTRLDAVEPPTESKWSLQRDVAPGAYRVEFLHGPDVFCRADVVAAAGERVAVQSVMQRLEVLGTGRTDPGLLPEGKIVSESIGWMQAGVLETTLALIGFKPFDRDNLVAGQLAGVTDWPSLVPPHRPDDPIIVVVLALEGNGWSVDPADLLRETRCALFNVWGRARPIDVRPLLGNQGAVDLDGRRIGFGVATGLGDAVLSPSLVVENSLVAKRRLGICLVPGHVTVITLVARPDGDLQVGQYVLPNPSSRGPLDAPNGARDLYKTRELSRWVRALHLAQRALVAPAGELQVRADVPFFEDIMSGQRYDPLHSAGVLLRQPRWRSSPATERILASATALRARPPTSSYPLDEAALVAGLLTETLAWRFDLVTRSVRPALLSTARLLASVALDAEVTDAAVLAALDVSDPDSLFLMERDPLVILRTTPEGTPTTNTNENVGQNVTGTEQVHEANTQVVRTNTA